MSIRRTFSVFFILFILFIAIVGTKIYMHEIETHEYFLILKEDNIEIREYPPRVVAMTAIEGDRYDALQSGFRILFDYIDANDISMTTPVIQYKDGNQWITEFIMPKKYDLNSLPKPDNKDILLKESHSKELAVIIFSGKNTDENLQKNLDILDEYIQSHNLISQNTAYYAFYNAPWIPPILRHNEVLVEVKKP